MNLFFWKHKHSAAVIKHEDFEKLPDEHKKKFEKLHSSKFKNGKADSTHHVMNNNGDYSLYATMGIGSVGLGFATGAAIGAVALAQAEQSNPVPEGPLPSPEFEGGSGGGGGATGSYDSSDVQSPTTDISQSDSINVPDNNSDNSFMPDSESGESFNDSSNSMDSGSSSFDSSGGF